ncbi:MAG: hypothetical protein R3343_03020 [Nitriliruptorales bacterium]|nr:hypothetical protein [Nitriliruptorales bacterium]
MRTPSRLRPMLQPIPILAATAVFTLSACGGADPAPVEDVADAAPATAAPVSDDGDLPLPVAPDTPDGHDGDDDSAPPVADDDADRPDHTGSDDAGFTVEPEGQELALVGNDTVEVLYTLDPEGESFFAAAAVRPGSTRTDMTVVVITHAEGMYDLRWLEVRDGEVGDLELFPAAYRMRPDLPAYEGVVPTVAWSPDANSIAWFEPGDDGAVLRTVGWRDGPGTGDTADDNASWGIEGAPAVLQARTWDVAHSDGSQTLLTAEDAAGGTYRLQLERQADGAWAYHGFAG